MEKQDYLIVAAIMILNLISVVSGAHYVVGIVHDALDGTSANNRVVVLWDPAVGMADNVTDIIGINGNSMTMNKYMIDCEMLNSSCKPGKDVMVRVFDSENIYISKNITVRITGRGYTLAQNITLNSPPNFTNSSLDDDITEPANEIDLLAAMDRTVLCRSIVWDPDGDSMKNARGFLFHTANSALYSSDDNNNHYTNNSCLIDPGYGDSNQSEIICGFRVRYNADPGNWRCTAFAEDNLSISANGSDESFVNSLLSIGLVEIVEYGSVSANTVSQEIVINVTNFGNVRVNISIEGYSYERFDNFSMNCSNSYNISIEDQKFNLTSPNPGIIDITSFQEKYINLSSQPKVYAVNLDYRKEEEYNEAVGSTYWRIYLPFQAVGSCSGNLIFGATNSPEE